MTLQGSSFGIKPLHSLLVWLVLFAVTACTPLQNSSSNNMRYAELDKWPDWSGWWTVEQGMSPAQMWIDNKDLFLPAARERIEIAVLPDANISADGLYCRQFRFVGDNGGAIEDVEFLITPGRLTITNESGLLRRIALDGRQLRANPEPSNGGTSVGQWQGDTLYVQTIGLHGDSIFPAPIPGGPLLGDGARVNERIRLIAPGKLEVQTEIIAPNMLKSALEFTTLYRRDINHVSRDLDLCAEDDRSIDPETGLQRFDLTPPEGLPPPP